MTVDAILDDPGRPASELAELLLDEHRALPVKLVRAATTANITLSGTQTVDGVVLKAKDRVLTLEQTDQAERRIWVVMHGDWLPALDADHPDKLPAGTKVTVQEGTANEGTTWRLETTGTIVLGTTALSWAEDGGGGAMSAADILAAIKTVDGAGSGLDADLLDGLSSADFATPASVASAIAALVDSSPSTLDTLNELAAALGDDPNFATTIATALGLKAPLASPTFTGIPVTPALSVTGLAGSVAGGRLVGFTADVAPTTDAHLVGDVVIGLTGRVWICTGAGTPGTWVEAGSGTYATLAGTSNLIDNPGDSLTGTADNTLGKLAKGTAFQVRRMNSAANAEEWATPGLALARPKTGSTAYPGWPNASAMPFAASTAIAGATDRFIPFEVRRPITITDVSCSTTTTAVGKTAYVGVVALNSDMQPSAAVSQQSTLALDSTGTHTWNPTTLTLDAGLYAVCWNHDSTATFRYWYFAVPGMAFNDGSITGNVVVSLEKARAAAAFSGTHSWDTPLTVAMSASIFSIYSAWMLKWTPS